MHYACYVNDLLRRTCLRVFTVP